MPREADNIGRQLDGEAEGQKLDDVKMASLGGGAGGLVQVLQFCRRDVRDQVQGL